MMMEMIDSIDLENNQITFKVLDGDLMKRVHSFLDHLTSDLKGGRCWKCCTLALSIRET